MPVRKQLVVRASLAHCFFFATPWSSMASSSSESCPGRVAVSSCSHCAASSRASSASRSTAAAAGRGAEAYEGEDAAAVGNSHEVFLLMWSM